MSLPPVTPTDLITHCRLPFTFDAERLRADLRLASARPWVSHFVSQNYRGDWSAIALRSASGSEGDIHAHPQAADAYACTDTALLLECAYLRQVLATFRCPVGTVRLMKLGAGSEILEHVDPGTGYESGELRLHVPVSTNPEVEFYLGGQRVEMRAGECWYLNFQLPHRVVNASREERVHLVIDCRLDAWMDEILRGLGFSAIEKYGTKARYLDNHIEGLRKLDTPPARAALAALLIQKAELESAQQARAATVRRPRVAE